MKIDGIVWLDSVVDKLESKHQVSVDEVEEVFAGKPRFRHVERGHRKGEDVYAAIGKTEAGRSLIVFFVYKPRQHDALVVSARSASRRERNL